MKKTKILYFFIMTLLAVSAIDLAVDMLYYSELEARQILNNNLRQAWVNVVAAFAVTLVVGFMRYKKNKAL